MDILINNIVNNPDISIDNEINFATFCLNKLDVPNNVEVSITYVDKETIHSLNKDYRGVDKPTDVLSFECDGSFFDEGNETQLLGDIVICPEICAEQCTDYGNSFKEELELLTCHGLLHLLGYDHIKDDDAHKMEAKEKELLSSWRENNG